MRPGSGFHIIVFEYFMWLLPLKWCIRNKSILQIGDIKISENVNVGISYVPTYFCMYFIQTYVIVLIRLNCKFQVLHALFCI